MDSLNEIILHWFTINEHWHNIQDFLNLEACLEAAKKDDLVCYGENGDVSMVVSPK